MATVEKVAAAHHRRQVTLARRAALQVRRVWREVDTNRITSSWRRLLGTVFTVVSSAQAIAAASAGPYLEDALESQGLPAPGAGRVNVNAFAGVASDGRDLAELLYQPAFRVLARVGQGATVSRAMMAGQLELDMIVRTQIADAGRAADQAALVARPQVTGYVRLLSPPSCSRCVILAGRKYRWNSGFLRHPRCDCRMIPAAEDTADDLRTDPKQYFRSLSPPEQDRTFTAGGAQAIRDGADIAQVVNARKGLYTAAGRSLTTQGGRRRSARPTTEQIYRDARDRDDAIRLLRLHGYLF